MADQMARGDMSLVGAGGTSGTSMSSGSADSMALDGSLGPMRMAWTGTTFALMLAMWWVMMIGMMVPSAAPMILLFGLIHRKRLADHNPLLRTTMFTLGYLLMWGAFSAIATAAQWLLTEALLLSPMMTSTSQWLGVGLLVAAGAYQLSPAKSACLRHCRSPIHFLSTRWRGGNAGALRMGIEHGAFCVGCCWFLMALLFIGGVMNLLWVAAIATFVLVEKLAPRGDLVGKASGLLMLGAAAYLAA